jgi:hypothetical protein
MARQNSPGLEAWVGRTLGSRPEGASEVVFYRKERNEPENRSPLQGEFLGTLAPGLKIWAILSCHFTAIKTLLLDPTLNPEEHLVAFAIYGVFKSASWLSLRRR